MSTTLTPQAQQIAVQIAHLGLFRKVAALLDTANILVMPLKGILLAHWVYDDPAERIRGDIDLLVSESDFDRAIQVLSNTGFTSTITWFNGRERTLKNPLVPIEIDLHRGLFALGRFQLPTRTLFERGKTDSSLFGVPVILPDPLDACAHIIGHAAADHDLHSETLEDDLERLAMRHHIDPAKCAIHLKSHGLSRAARFVLTPLRRNSSFAAEVVAALPADLLGNAIVSCALALSRSFPINSMPSRLAGYLTNSSLPRAAYAGMIAVANRLRVTIGKPPL